MQLVFVMKFTVKFDLKCIFEYLMFKIYLGGHPPRPPRMYFAGSPPVSPLSKILDLPLMLCTIVPTFISTLPWILHLLFFFAGGCCFLGCFLDGVDCRSVSTGLPVDSGVSCDTNESSWLLVFCLTLHVHAQLVTMTKRPELTA